MSPPKIISAPLLTGSLKYNVLDCLPPIGSSESHFPVQNNSRLDECQD